MHGTALVVVPPDVGIGDSLALYRTVSQVMDPFYEEREVAPYRVYHDAEWIHRVAAHYGFPDDDLARIATQCEDWDGAPGAVDERGLYTTHTRNPVGKWDGYTYIRRSPYNEGILLRARLRDMTETLFAPDRIERGFMLALVAANPKPLWAQSRIISGSYADPTWLREPSFHVVAASIRRDFPDHLGISVDFHW